MGAAAAEHPLIEAARRALRTMAAAPMCVRSAKAAQQELESEWSKLPLAIGIGGHDVAGRTALFDRLCGGGVFDQRTRLPGCAAVRIRRGEATRFRAVRVDGPAEDGLLPAGGVDLEASARVTDATKLVRAREREVVTAAALVPVALRRKPPAWAFWLWIYRFFVMLRARGHVAAHERALTGVVEARRELADAQHDLDARETPLTVARRRFFEQLGELASGAGRGVGVHEIELEIAVDAVPSGIEVLELNGWSHAAATVDAVVIVLDGLVQAPGGRNGTTLPIGKPDAVLARLPELLCHARAVRLARRAADQAKVGVTELDLVIDRAAVDFAHRVARVEELRITDRAAFIIAERTRMAPQIAGTVTAVLEHANVYLSSELAQQTQEWQRAVVEATTNDELKAAVHAVDDGAAALARISAEVRTLVMGGLGGGTRDLYADLVESLLPRGLPEQHAKTPRAAAEVRGVDVLASLARATSPRLADSQSWLTGLVRSLDHRRTELAQKVEAYGQRLVQLAHAEMLDVEPQLHGALADALTTQLEAAIDHQIAWLDGELARVRAGIDKERTALATVVQQRADLRRDLDRLTSAIKIVEDAQPAVSQAAAATPAIGSAAT
ncbi:MAG TPA: hypothetical protein VM261_08195 [Kofleriaceae bacterium]|nr:hypothetical protein [Kofleriaceae bacterium]